MIQSLTLPSFAKINWSLRVLGKRADGFHEIKTTLQTISLHDRLHFEAVSENKISLVCTDPEIPTDNGNLVIRAANALRNRYSISEGVSIKLEKNIPTQAGLGGGSSNAAVTLLALAHLWKLEIDISELVRIGAALGADVPFFLWGGRVLATGTGTTLQPQPDASLCRLIVIAPNAGVSTQQAYASLNVPNLTPQPAETMLSSSQNDAFFDDSHPWLRAEFENDFESVIFDIYPEVRQAKTSLLAAGATRALLCGSGSSVFGVFANDEAQQLALKKIPADAGWRIFPCVTLSRNEYQNALGDQLFRSHAL